MPKVEDVVNHRPAVCYMDDVMSTWVVYIVSCTRKLFKEGDLRMQKWLLCFCDHNGYKLSDLFLWLVWATRHSNISIVMAQSNHQGATLSFRLSFFAVFNFSTLFQQHSGHGRFFLPPLQSWCTLCLLKSVHFLRAVFPGLDLVWPRDTLSHPAQPA